MAVLPDKEITLIEFCEAHQPVWAISPPSIGLTGGWPYLDVPPPFCSEKGGAVRVGLSASPCPPPQAAR